MKRFELDEVKLFNAGIAEKRGEATLYFMPKFTVSSTFQPDDSVEQLERNEEFTVNALSTSSNRFVATAFRLLPQFFQKRIARQVMNAYAERISISCPLLSVSDVIEEQGLDTVDLLKVD